ncbi:hypothetical protein AAMO2058_001018000 [Amorphochlora amoebiformis]
MGLGLGVVWGIVVASWGVAEGFGSVDSAKTSDPYEEIRQLEEQEFIESDSPVKDPEIISKPEISAEEKKRMELWLLENHLDEYGNASKRKRKRLSNPKDRQGNDIDRYEYLKERFPEEPWEKQEDTHHFLPLHDLKFNGPVWEDAIEALNLIDKKRISSTRLYLQRIVNCTQTFHKPGRQIPELFYRMVVVVYVASSRRPAHFLAERRRRKEEKYRYKKPQERCYEIVTYKARRSYLSETHLHTYKEIPLPPPLTKEEKNILSQATSTSVDSEERQFEM